MPIPIQSEEKPPKRPLLKIVLYSLLSSTVIVALLYVMGWARPHSIIFVTRTDLTPSITNAGFAFFGLELPLNFAFGWPFLAYIVNHLSWKRLLVYKPAGPKA